MTSRRRLTPAKFYQEDIVQLVHEPKSYGVVLRCWHDAEDIPASPEQIAADPLMRPLKHGEVGVSFFARGPDLPPREILLESELTLVDRLYQPGDLLKRSVDDVRSGIVTSIDVKGRLEHAITGEEIPGWKGKDEVECYIDVDMGDYVVYDDWVGQVVEMFDEAIVEMSTGTLVRLPELSARLAVGERGPNILPPPMSGMQSLMSFFLGNARPSAQDTVIDVKRTVLAIAWLAINQSLDPEAAAQRVRPPRFWHGPELDKLTLVRRRAEQALRVGDRVLLKNVAESPVSTHGREGEGPGILTVRTLVVKETRTTANVLWQDGTRETVDVKETIPYLNPDEYDCWPGDHVIWKGEDNKRPAVVQSVNALDRTAYVRYIDDGSVELASVLELDPHGSSDWSSVSPVEGLGLHRGEFIFIHKEGTTNGAEKPMVPRIGEMEDWVRESPMAGVTENGQLGGWRRIMAEIGNDIAQRRGKHPAVEEGKLRRPQPNDKSLNWFGEVIDLRLDGTVDIMLPDNTSVNLPLERLTRLYDGLEQLEDMWDDDLSDSQDSVTSTAPYDDEEVWALNERGEWETDVEDDGDWSTDEEGMDVDPEGWSSAEPTATNGLPPVDIKVNGDADLDEDASPQPIPQDVAPSEPENDAVEPSASATSASLASEEDKETHWKRFDVLPSAPIDHAYYTTTPSQPSRNFLARLSKEYRVLSSSLPDTVIVRAYEDRSDLLRCLIIGPENTPYEDAPFVIDWMLDSNFPQSPPIAHFHSWTNGNGRVNPNLYEEGKVCLSILGTWAGDKNEMWSSSRSSLLQAFVSIQGLVLVKEPWFCEPAYEKLRGTEEGIVNSRLYSEKAYVLSRGFVRRALELPPGSLEAELRWLYFTNGRLKKILQDARALIAKSRAPAADSEADKELAVPRLTGGGIITLERTLGKLQAIYDAQCAA